MNVKTIDDVDLSGKTVLVRCDLNVPLGKDDKGRVIVADDSRIEASLPTLKKLLEEGCKVAACSHLGKPKGERKEELSLRPVAAVLEEKLGTKVHFADDCIGPTVTAYLHNTGPGELCLLENLRFHPGEKANDPDFAKQLASPFEAYVNDAFGTCHREHASMLGVVEYLNPAVLGYLVAKEVEYFEKLLQDPPRPLVMVFGGLKLSTKLGILRNVLDKSDKILVGGAMAFTFLKAQGYSTGGSPVEDDFLGNAREILDKAGDKLVLPIDWVVAPAIDSSDGKKVTGDENVPDGLFGVDIGPKTVKLFEGEICKAGSLFWNGPMGVFETSGFEEGTKLIAQTIADCPGISVVGGGDSVYAIRKLGLDADKYDHISTGGGASLKYVEKGSLPGIEVLDKK